MKILITSGGTKVKIDDVRHIGNMSSGTFGAKIGLAALEDGHDVVFLKAKGSKSPLIPDLNHSMNHKQLEKVMTKYMLLSKLYFDHLTVIEYEDFYDYSEKIFSLVKEHKFDSVILAAAASDYGVVNPVKGKIRSKDKDMVIQLEPLPKIISSMRDVVGDDCILVGFKLLVNSTDEELVLAAADSFKKNRLDYVVANDLRDIKNDDHKLKIVYGSHNCMSVNDDKLVDNFLAKVVLGMVSRYFTYVEMRQTNDKY